MSRSRRYPLGIRRLAQFSPVGSRKKSNRLMVQKALVSVFYANVI